MPKQKTEAKQKLPEIPVASKTKRAYAIELRPGTSYNWNVITYTIIDDKIINKEAGPDDLMDTALDKIYLILAKSSS